MAVSLELSMVQRNQAESARLAAAMSDFLLRGGQISTTPPMQTAPKPYGRKMSATTKATPKARKRDRASRAYSAELIDRIAEMAETMTCAQVSEVVNLTQNQLRCMGTRNSFTFAAAGFNAGHSNLVLNQIDHEADAKNVERIKAFRDLGISQRQAQQRMGIGCTMFRRLIADYDIDYPVCVGGKPWAVPA